MLPELTLVLGGAASGKSAFAEDLVTRAGKTQVYVATAQAYDAEMKEKISRHQALRGEGWRTIEAPMDVGAALRSISGDQAVLVDCATMWLSNQMLAENNLSKAREALIKALVDCAAPVVVVSNEVGQSVVPENALARQFRDAQGRLNQHLAARAGLVINVIAGLPQVLKGQLP